MKFYLILHRIRSAYNVGSIFRTADGVGVDKIFVTGFTQRPSDKEYKFQTKAEKMLSKTALGANQYVEWEGTKNISTIIDRLKKEGIQIVALEQDERSIDYRKLNSQIKKRKNVKGIALILGNEPKGIDKRILKKCNFVIEIPMRGQKKSLNVAVAAGIASYEIKQR